jgi:hypothetical protein
METLYLGTIQASAFIADNYENLDSRQRQYFSLLHSVQTDSGVHPASYPMATGGSFPGGTVAGA